MPGLEPLLAHVVPFAFVVARMTGLFLFAPMVASLTIPFQVKALLAVIMGAAVYPAVSTQFADVPLDLAGLTPILVSELLIGLCVGVIASVPVMMLQMGGHVTGFQMGLSMATVYNPEFNTNSDVIGETLFYLGFAVFLAVGGVEATYAALLTTFDNVPVGAMATSSVPLDTFVGLANSGFEMALRVSGPAMAMVFLVMVAMGFVTKTMPQINVMSIGFAVKIVVGLLATAVSLQVIANVMSDETMRVLVILGEWVRGLSPHGG
ncbi:MAG: flagellar biosynthetic protein FliR [Planctomycetota bacterium]|nr:MAG: flagellar biosynthetic protein FliR [Planctomycetota bacterium]